MATKQCSACSQEFTCGLSDESHACWCADLPMVMPLDTDQDCLCPTCLQIAIKEAIESGSRST